MKGGFQNAMNKLKWYQKLLIALTVIIFSPLIVAGIIIAGIYTLRQMPKNKKKYTSLLEMPTGFFCIKIF